MTSEKSKYGSLWRHIKTGKVYMIVGSCTLEATGETAFLYKCTLDQRPWARSITEFMDGRFERVE